jgi:acyl-CoA thioesterase I
MNKMIWAVLLLFFWTATLYSQEPIDNSVAKFNEYLMRGNLMRSFQLFSKGGKARVAFMGGSVTTKKWRLAVHEYLEKRFPKTEFDFIMAGIGGTNADLGAFRLPAHVFGKGKVDLFFLEFAVNGGGVRSMEGIVRQAKTLNPDIDIIIMYFANTKHVSSYNKGEIPRIVQNHEKVAECYKIPVLYLYREIGRRIKEAKLKWKDFSKDTVHPNSYGCQIYSECVLDFLNTAWKDPQAGILPLEIKLPEKIDPLCYENGRFIELDQAKLTNGFKRVKKWRTTERTCNFRPPVDILEAKEPGSELSLDFTGKAIGVYIIGGTDNGILEYSIDGSGFRDKKIFDKRFHLPRHKIFVSNLDHKKHKLVLRVSKRKHKDSLGHAVRIFKFIVN